MKDFGLAGEGVTDQIVLENVLFGLYDGVDDFELDVDEIAYLQPLLDATDASRGWGNWNNLLTYLDNKRFRDDVVNHRFMIIQVDTDVAGEKGFDVALTDKDNQPLSVEEIVDNVRHRLIAQIDAAKESFYAENQHKIIFAISVHSLECWLYCLHKNAGDAEKVQGCEQHLRRVLAKDKRNPLLSKNQKNYDQLSELFHKKKGKKIAEVAKIDASFRIFIERLQSLPFPPSEAEV